MLRVLVCPHDLITGGSQLNAIDLAARLRDRGHLVRIYAPPGELQHMIERRGLAYHAAPPFRGDSLRPRSVLAMAAQIRSFAPDVVHTFESPPALLSAAAALLVPHQNVTTVMSMSLSDHLPRSVPLFVGTNDLLAEAERRSGPVHLMEPPVDTHHDRPADTRAARERLGLSPSDFVISVVGRLSAEHEKAKGIASAVRELGAHVDASNPVVLLIAGQGDESQRVHAAADAASNNSNLRVHILGNVKDPRDVYDAADIVFGMGSSALRAMAHGKPLIVQGAGGFWKLLTPESAPIFFASGFFGREATEESFFSLVERLRKSPAARDELGRYGVSLINERYSLDLAVCRVEQEYLRTVEHASTYSISAVTASLGRYARFRVATKLPGVRARYRKIVGRHGTHR
ncbi:glycosyltransferase family 4 protein [Microbacterium sp. NPDC055312]